MSSISIYTTVNGERRAWKRAKPGPKPSGYISVHVEIRPEQLAALKAVNSDCGGYLPVNEQIRRAIDGYLQGLVYTSSVNT